MNWQDDAECLGHDPELWFPGPRASQQEVIAQAREAVLICAGCPVREACLADAMRVEGNAAAVGRHGIRAGLSPRQRANLHRRSRPKPVRARDDDACGTPAGYQRHRTDGETACDRCKAAAAERRAELRAAERQALAA